MPKKSAILNNVTEYSPEDLASYIQQGIVTFEELRNNTEGEFTAKMQLDVAAEKFRRIVRQAQFLTGFALQGLLHIFAPIDMSSHCGVPFVRLDILPGRAVLHKESALRVKHMEMHHGVEQHRTTVAFAASGFPHHLTFFVDEWQEF